MAADDASRKAWTSVDQRVQQAVSPGDFRRIADARRQMWTSGFVGMAGGLAAGVAAFIVTRVLLLLAAGAARRSRMHDDCE